MKILFVVQDCITGGVANALINLSNKLSNNNHDITILNLDYPCKKQKLYFLNKKIKFRFLNDKSQFFCITFKQVKSTKDIKNIFIYIYSKLVNKNSWLKYIWKNEYQKEKYDLAISFKHDVYSSFYTINCVNANKKIIFLHGEFNNIGYNNHFQEYLPKFDKILCVSNAVKDQFINMFPNLINKFDVSYNIINTHFILSKSKEICSFKFDCSKINIVSVLRISKEKGILRIPIIINNLIEENILNFHWYIVGDGPIRTILEQEIQRLKINKYITLSGNQNNPYSFIHNSDFTVLPTYTESFGIAVVESMILGKPVVASKYDALYEIIQDNETGLITEQNIDDLTDKIKKMILNENNIKTKLTDNLKNYKYNNDDNYKHFVNCLDLYNDKN